MNERDEIKKAFFAWGESIGQPCIMMTTGELKAFTAGTAWQAARTKPVVPEWIAMDTMKPRERDKDVLLYTKYHVAYVGRLRSGHLGEPQPNEVAWRCSSSGRFTNPTHWMSLPDAPMEKTDG
jgi:hypothetical protein